MKAYLLIITLACIFFIPFLGEVNLFDWDEINFAEASREMIITGDYLRVSINFQPFWEKPPLFFWMQSASMHLFGINEFAARLPNAICGIFTLLSVFCIGQKLYNKKFGWLWTFVYLGTLLPHFYFKSGIIDPWFNLFIFSSLYCFILFIWKRKAESHVKLSKNRWLYLLFSGILMGCAIMTKGPAALLIAGLCMLTYWISVRFKMYLSVTNFITWLAIVALLPAIWFGLETMKNGPWFVQTFIEYQIRLFSTQDAGHGGFFGYHFVVLLLGCFPASFFALRSFFKMPDEKHSYQNDFKKWMKILFWVVLILFSVVQSKIVHYSSLAYFPLTFLASLVIFQIIEKRIAFSFWIKTLLIATGGLFATVILSIPSIMAIPELYTYVEDPFISGNLQAPVSWTGWEVLPGIFLIILLAIYLYRFKKVLSFRNFYGFFIATAIFTNTTIISFTKRVEGYTQRSAINFIKSKANEDCHIISYSYKSYAPLFYSNKQKPINKIGYDYNWLLRGRLDKDLYIITKMNKAHKIRKLNDVEELGTSGGYVFFARRSY